MTPLEGKTIQWATDYFSRLVGAGMSPTSWSRYEHFAELLCESPIEQRMLAILMCCPFGACSLPLPVIGVHTGEFNMALRANAAMIIPQFTVGAHRLDFCVHLGAKITVHGPTRFAVECDGIEFHSSEEALTADRRRDRDLLAAGVPVIRFTGKEIHNDALACGRAVNDVGKRLAQGLVIQASEARAA